MSSLQELIRKTDADIIDINMGCPVRKVLKAESGCLLLTNPDKVYQMVSEVVKNVSKPVSVKIRAGWDHNNINCIETSQAIEKAGASLIAIHGRTKSDLYSGKVNLDYIKMVKDNVKIPVIGNGDIRSIEDAVKMFEYTNVDFIMVGRGSFGNPWVIRDLVDYFDGKIVKPKPTEIEKIEMCEKHFFKLLEIKPEKLAVLEMRSLASWYVKGISNNKDFKQKLINITRKEEILCTLWKSYEPIRSVLTSNNLNALDKDIAILFNELVRHCEDKIYNLDAEKVSNISNEEREKCLDRIYDMFLLGMLHNNYIGFKNEIKELYKGEKQNETKP
jgi:nifR3 family TIM-barrel protein